MSNKAAKLFSYTQRVWSVYPILIFRLQKLVLYRYIYCLLHAHLGDYASKYLLDEIMWNVALQYGNTIDWNTIYLMHSEELPVQNASKWTFLHENDVHLWNLENCTMMGWALISM